MPPKNIQNNPMKTKPKLAPLMVGAIVLTAFTGSGNSVPTSINGIISFSGSATVNGTNLEDATSFLSFGPVTVGSSATVTGDYTGTAAASANFTPFTWDPVGASLPVQPLWSFASEGNTYAFNLGSLKVDYVSPTALVLSGFGTASVTGPGLEKTDTAGLWILSGQTLGSSSFTFSATTMVPPPTTGGQSVPDGGTTALLLGLGVCGVGWLRRKTAV